MTQDTLAPTLVSYQLSTYEIDLSKGDAVIDVTARITDDISGVRLGTSFAYWLSPSGQQVYNTFSTLTSGTPLNGIYADPLTLGSFSENGVWTLAGFQTGDEAGNYKVYDAVALEQLGVRTTLIVARGVTIIESENNGTVATADPLALGTTIAGQLASATDLDFFKVAVSAPGVLQIQFTRPESYFYSWRIAVFASDGLTPLAVYNDAQSGDSFGTGITFSLGIASAGNYYIRVSAPAASSHSSYQYALTITDIFGAQQDSNIAYQESDGTHSSYETLGVDPAVDTLDYGVSVMGVLPEIVMPGFG